MGTKTTVSTILMMHIQTYYMLLQHQNTKYFKKIVGFLKY